MDLSDVFDSSLAAPSVADLRRDLTAALTYRPDAAGTDGIPHGRGHRVLVIPGLLTGDPFTLPLRNFLAACGYRAEGWGLGLNWGPTPRLVEGLRARLAEAADDEGGPVSVIGVSMGGILARDLAHDHPERVRRLVTIVSPVRFPTASPLEPVVRLLSPFYSDEVSAARYGGPLPMPVMAVFTRSDGLLAWQSCTGGAGDCHEVEVDGAHATICRNPSVHRAVAEWLGRA
jgi:pimeloyl-ACP methyl ester carboxylesterase